MRYIIETHDDEGIIGMQIAKWAENDKLSIIEKAEPVIDLQLQLEKVAKALDILNKAGYNNELMETDLMRKTGLGLNKIRPLLKSQQEFFKQIGVKIWRVWKNE